MKIAWISPVRRPSGNIHASTKFAYGHRFIRVHLGKPATYPKHIGNFRNVDSEVIDSNEVAPLKCSLSEIDYSNVLLDLLPALINVERAI